MRTLVICCFVVLVVVSLGLPLLSPVPPLSEREGAQVPREQRERSVDPHSGLWHRSSHGETLRSIASHYYGSARQWRTLQIANSAAMVPPSGTLLWIPGLRDEMDALDDVALRVNREP